MMSWATYPYALAAILLITLVFTFVSVGIAKFVVDRKFKGRRRIIRESIPVLITFIAVFVFYIILVGVFGNNTYSVGFNPAGFSGSPQDGIFLFYVFYTLCCLASFLVMQSLNEPGKKTYYIGVMVAVIAGTINGLLNVGGQNALVGIVGGSMVFFGSYYPLWNRIGFVRSVSTYFLVWFVSWSVVWNLYLGLVLHFAIWPPGLYSILPRV